MRNYILQYREDHEMGTMGFIIKNGPLMSYDYNAGDGRSIAHDILEHPRLKDIGSIGDELMASGGVWYVRGQMCDFNRHTPQESIGSDLVNMFIDFYRGEPLGMPVPNKYRHDMDIDFEDTIRYASERVHREISSDEICCKHLQECKEKFFPAALMFMRAGYDHAAKRFDRIGGASAANRLFHKIKEAIDHALNDADYEYQEFKLQINFKKQFVYCEEYSPYD